MRRRILRASCFAVAVVIAALAGARWWQRASGERAMVRSSRPTPPDLRGWPDELRRRVAAASGESIAALAELSRLYHANGFFAEAAGCYDALEKLQPENPRWLHRHAVILAGYGDAEPAIVRWRRVIALAPNYLPARLRLGELLLKTERRDEAAEVYREILVRNAGDPYALLGVARLDFEAGRWEAARTRLETIATQTNYALGYDLLVSVYDHFGQRREAAAVRGRAKASGAYRDPADPWIDELLDVCFDAYRLSLAAGVASRSGDHVTAQKLLERALTLAPEDVAARFQLAGVLVDRGELSRAREELERCTIVAPKFPDGWAHLAALLERGGDQAGAEGILAAGLKNCPDSPGLHLMRARRLREAGRFPEAIADYRASIRFRPNEADAHLELATTFFRLERVPEGMSELHAALAAEPEHPMALSLLAFSAISNGTEAEAREWMRRVQDQPRVPREQSDRLLGAFRERFGREFR